MAKLKLLSIMALVAFALSSCVVQQSHMITGASVGSKVGIAKTNMFNAGGNTLEAAAKNGGITKIGTVDIKTTVFIIPFFKITVTGE